MILAECHHNLHVQYSSQPKITPPAQGGMDSSGETDCHEGTIAAGDGGAAENRPAAGTPPQV